MTLDEDTFDGVDVDVMAMDLDPVGAADPEPSQGRGLLARGRRKAPEHRPVWHGMEPPPADAPFEDKMAYYRQQHSTVGVRATHLIGIPGAAMAIPMLLVRPKVGAIVFAASWALQVGGHRVFEGNSPALTKGFVTYQLCGLAFWCEEVGDRVKGR